MILYGQDCSTAKMKIHEHRLLQLLAPFFITVTLYFNLRNVLKDNLVLYAILKVSPIVSLHWFVKQRQKEVIEKTEASCLKYLSIALIFSGLGDILLVWPVTFLYGIGAFGLSHIMYINYFGIHPRNNSLGIVLFTLNSLVFFNISSTLNGFLLVAVLIYSNLLVGMVWRSLDQVYHCKIKKFWSVLGALGGLLFCFSDLMIAVTMFVRPMQHSEVLIMSTYYAAQVSITLSTLKF